MYIVAMHRYLFLLACLVVFLSGCAAPGGALPQRHLLWKVSDADSYVYLLGSVHFADSSFYPLDSVMETTFGESDYLAVELDMTDETVLKEVAVQSVKYALLEEGRTLDGILPRDLLNSLDSLCGLWNVPVEAFYRFRPWAVAMNLSSMEIQRMGFDPNLGIDLHFLKAAHEKGKGVIALETVEEQVNALAGVGIADSVGIYYLKSALREMPLLDSMVAGFMQAWKTGDDSLFTAIMEMESSAENAADSLLEREINERVYFARNRKMAESVENFLKDNRKVFVVVGAAHLLGKEENVLELLRRRGFKVQKM